MTVRLWLPGTYPDWRAQAFYQGKKWAERSRLAHDAHERVWGALLEQYGVAIPEFPCPVVVTVIQYAHRPPDPDNSPVKVIIDGLRHAGLLRDDTYKDVVEVRLRSRKAGKRGEGVEVVVEEAQHGE